MTKKNKKTYEPSKYQDLVFDQWTTVYNGRWNMELEWFQAYLFYLGYQNSTFNNLSRELKIGEKFEDCVNKIYSTVRSVANYITRNRPRWEVIPMNLMEDGFKFSKDNARQNKLLDYYAAQNQTKRKIRSAVKDALLTSVGVIQTVWNSSAMDGDGDVDFNVIDPFDFYVDPMATSIKTARFCVYSTAMTVDGIKKSGIFNEEEIAIAKAAVTSQKSANGQKETIMFFKNGMAGTTQKTGNVLYREHTFYDDDGSVLIAYVICDRVIKVKKLEDTKYLPFSIFQTDENSRSIYGVAMVQNLITLQKRFNELFTSISEYNRYANKASYGINKGARVETTDGKHCRVIEATAGSNFQVLPTPTLSPALTNQIELIERAWEDISGQSEASRGRVPTGVTSGRGLEILQIGDANNLSNLVENFEDFMEDIGAKILELCAHHYTECRNILVEDTASRKEFMRVIGMGIDGKEDKEGNKPVTISDKNLVRVYIGSYLTETPQSKIERLERLAQMGAIDTETLLIANQMTDIDDIVERKKEEQAEEANVEMQKQAALQGATGTAGGAMPQQPGQVQQPSAGVMAAIGAIESIMGGQQPETPEAPGGDYLDYLVNFSRSEEGQELQPDQQQVLAQLIAQVQQTIGG